MEVDNHAHHEGENGAVVVEDPCADAEACPDDGEEVEDRDLACQPDEAVDLRRRGRVGTCDRC